MSLSITGKAAVISACGKFRHYLAREWGYEGQKKGMVFIMLNPSTADAKEDDPTIRRCIGFANRQGCTKLEVVNLFDYRASNPKELLHAPQIVSDECSKYVHETIARAMALGSPIVAAWGRHPLADSRYKLLFGAPFKKPALLCLGVNQDGSPKHPLYISTTHPLIAWPRPVEPTARSLTGGSGGKVGLKEGPSEYFE
jgi:hypothetical protein